MKHFSHRNTLLHGTIQNSKQSV